MTSYLKCTAGAYLQRWKFYFYYKDATHYYVLHLYGGSGSSYIVSVYERDGAGEVILTSMFGLMPSGYRIDSNWLSNYRVTWWVAGGVLFIRFEYWNGSAWVQLGDDKTDATPLTPAAGDKYGVEFFNVGIANLANGWADVTKLEYKN